MKILLLTQVLPYPPNSGPKFKTWNVLKYLSQHHRVVLASFVREDPREAVQAIERLGVEVHTVTIKRGVLRDLWFLLQSLHTREPFMILRDHRRAMRRLVLELTLKNRFDVVQADQLNMAQYAPHQPGVRRVLDAHNSLWVLYQRLAEVTRPGPTQWLFARDWPLLKEYEGRVCRDFDQVVAVSLDDREALRQAAGQALDIHVIPITLDLDELQVIPPSRETGHILHMGTMYWPPNSEGVLWFLNDVWPTIRQHHDKAIFDVVGARPPKQITAIGRSDHRVEVHGFVENPRQFLSAASVLIVPVRAGSGMRVKILDGLARGLPIVTTSLGLEGIEAQSGEHLIVADTAEAFAEAVLRLLTDGEMAISLARAGRELVSRRYDYRRVLRDLDLVYEDGLPRHVPAHESAVPITSFR